MTIKTLFLFISYSLVVNAAVVKHHIVLRSVKDGNTNATDDDWWRTAFLYQIYPRSFMDSNADGIGDLQGIISKLNHLQDMGVSALWLSPIYKSPGVDQGYDISDYRDIDPIFGKMDDLKELIKQAHLLGIKVIMDFVPNHTSDQHDWFVQSRDHPTSAYGDYYVWKNPKTDENNHTIPPNNWISAFGGSAWQYDKQRQQYYLHAFTTAQPDLNYRNNAVVQAMKDVLKFWLNIGVDGFRMDAVPHLFEDSLFRDEPLSDIPGVDSSQYNYLKHIYTQNLNETYEMIYQFRQVLDDFNKGVNYSRIMMTEAYSDNEQATMEYYGSTDGLRDGAHFTFNFNLITDLKANFSADDLISAINKWLSYLPKRYVSNWVLGNHDQHRVATRFGVKNIDAFNMLVAFLPGIQVTYNGEEIGMEDGEVKCEQGHDPVAIANCTTFAKVSRDFERTPFHWENATNAGFSNSSTTWLPVSKKYVTNNLKDQSVPGAKSHYGVYKSAIRFRQNFKNISSDAVSLIKLSDNVLQIVRKTDKGEFVYLFNTGDKKEEVQVFKTTGELKVVVADGNSGFAVGSKFQEKGTLSPHESIILELSQVSGSGPKNPVWLLSLIFSVAIFLVI